jgi:hypothetical protein
VTVKLEAPPEDDPRDRRTLEGQNPFAGAVVSNITPRIADSAAAAVVAARRRGHRSSRQLDRRPLWIPAR